MELVKIIRDDLLNVAKFMYRGDGKIIFIEIPVKTVACSKLSIDRIKEIFQQEAERHAATMGYGQETIPGRLPE